MTRSTQDSKRAPGKTRVRNEAVWLYEMNVDQWLSHDGYVIIDSSLGLLHESENGSGCARH